jgi:RHS repeat-associated protein
MTDASGVTAYRYDNRNRLVEKATPQGTLLYAYDSRGNITNISSTTPDGVRLSYAYDALNRLGAVADPHAGTTGYSYDPVGNLSGYLLPNEVLNSYEYDSLNRLTNLTARRFLNTLANYAYTVNPSGHRSSSIETLIRNPLNPVPYTISRLYHYDPTYRLTNETISAPQLSTPATLNYTYDAVGNRQDLLSTLAEIPSATYGYDANDRLTSDTYDNNGNTLTAPGFGMAQPDRYDFENRLIERTVAGKTVTITYDGDGNRARKTVTTATNTVTTLYLVDTVNPTGYAQVLEEHVSQNSSPPTLQRVYTFGLTLLAQDQLLNGAWTVRYHGLDGHGNTRYLTDALGDITDTYDYDAFGNLIAQSGTTPNNFLFTSEQFDPDLALYFLRARYQDTTTGRFWTMDTFLGLIEDPESLHKYLYASADPVNGIDPSGQITLPELATIMGIGAIIGGIVSAVQNWEKTGAEFWTQVAWGAGVGAITAPIGGYISGALMKAIAPLARVALTPLFRMLGAIRPIVLTSGMNAGQRLLVHVSRFFFRTTQTYPSVGSTTTGKILQWIFPRVNWQQHHAIIQQAWSRSGGPNQFFDDALANEGLRRLGNGLWNLIPIPAAMNRALGNSPAFTAAFATLFYGTVVWGSSFVHSVLSDTIFEGQPNE